MTVPELIRQAADRYGRREFLRFPGESLSFAEVDARSDRMARALAGRGVRPGDRVAVMLDNVPGWPLSWIAILKAGAITVPINVRYRAADLSFVLRDSGAVAVITSPEYAPLVEEVGGRVWLLDSLTGPDSPDSGGFAVPAKPDDVANFQYTSGTTGFPKACMLTHEYWIDNARLTADAVGLRDDDVMIIAQAFSYMDPQWTSLMCAVGGIPIVVLPRFSASGFWRSVREHGATLTYVLGTMPLLLYKQPPDPLDRDNRMRLVLCSGIQPDLHRAFEERWGAPWRELYGSTETGLDLMTAPDAVDTVGTGALGHPPPGKEVKVLPETGEIVVRGRPMMKGYWNRPDPFRDGWYHTGDLGFVDSAGYIHHAGRLKDMVRRGGENISCAEVESVLAQHPAVLSVALVPIPDELWGELPKAFIQLRPGHEPTLETALSVTAHARERLARFKVPAFVEFVEGFQLTPSARIEKRHLLRPGKDQRADAFDVQS
ncbi:class I adenylate-forming enzyme family protein [Thermoactinospora rubra]|uniref:class I adenylate-forming enzyme family protein n=1 Tax=Thermoactinospora rubra TaxID=1088767 RepID=UPI001F0A11CB|nr:AMP-binding protein [Thermoactinospora rubra]